MVHENYKGFIVYHRTKHNAGKSLKNQTIYLIFSYVDITVATGTVTKLNY